MIKELTKILVLVLKPNTEKYEVQRGISQDWGGEGRRRKHFWEGGSLLTELGDVGKYLKKQKLNDFS